MAGLMSGTTKVHIALAPLVYRCYTPHGENTIVIHANDNTHTIVIQHGSNTSHTKL